MIPMKDAWAHTGHFQTKTDFQAPLFTFTISMIQLVSNLSLPTDVHEITRMFCRLLFHRIRTRYSFI